MVKLPSEPQRKRHWSRDYLAGVGWGSIPLVIFLSAALGASFGGLLGLSLASWLLVLTVLAYGVEVVAFYRIRKRGAFTLGLVTMLILTLLLASFFLYQPLSSGHS